MIPWLILLTWFLRHGLPWPGPIPMPIPQPGPTWSTPGGEAPGSSEPGCLNCCAPIKTETA